jgi:hypothetical protein
MPWAGWAGICSLEEHVVRMVVVLGVKAASSVENAADVKG